LLEVLEGHEAPVSSLTFSPAQSQKTLLASASWDHTVKVWDVFSGNSVSKDSLMHNSDVRFSPILIGDVFFLLTHICSAQVLCVTFRPDGKELASASLDGRIAFWDPVNAQQLGSCLSSF